MDGVIYRKPFDSGAVVSMPCSPPERHFVSHEQFGAHGRDLAVKLKHLGIQDGIRHFLHVRLYSGFPERDASTAAFVIGESGLAAALHENRERCHQS